MALGFGAVVELELGIFRIEAALHGRVIAAARTPDIKPVLAGREKIGLFGRGQIIGYGHTGGADAKAHRSRQPNPIHFPTTSAVFRLVL